MPVQFVEVGNTMNEVQTDKLIYNCFTQSINIHRSTRCPMLNALANLLRAFRILTEIIRLILRTNQ